MIDDLIAVLDVILGFKNYIIKVISWFSLIFGLLILFEPAFSVGLVPEGLIESTLRNTLIGTGLMGIGAVFMTGIPNISKMWENIEYGVPMVAFFLGLSAVYINIWGSEAFVQNLMGYMVLASIAGMAIVFIQAVYKQQ